MGKAWAPFGAVALCILLWSTAYGISGFVMESASASVLSVGRFLIATPPLIALALRAQPPGRPTLWQTLLRPGTVLLGLTGVTLYYWPANEALNYTTPGTSALLAAAAPVITAVLAVFLMRERLGGRVIAGLALATVGVALVALDNFTLNAGVLLVILGTVAYCLYTVLLRRWADPATPTGPEPPAVTDTVPIVVTSAPTATVLATATSIWGTVLMLPWLAWDTVAGRAALPADGASWAALAFLALAVTLPTMVLFNYGAERIPAAISGISLAGIPVLGYAFALLLGERFDWLKALGGVVALVGIVIATVPRRSPSVTEPDRFVEQG